MMQSEVSSQVNMKKAKATIKSLPLEGDIEIRKPTATIKSLPLEVDIMIIEWLPLKDALNLAKALKLPQKVAVQYFSYDRSDLLSKYDLQPSSLKFLFKNKWFQIEADLYQKTWAAVGTKDLDFVKNYLEQVKPDLDYAFVAAADWGFTDAVKLLLSDYGVDPSACKNRALRWASKNGDLEIVKLLESHPSFEDVPLEQSDSDSSLSDSSSSLAESDY